MADDPVTADARSRIGLLRSYAAAIVNTPEALDLDAVMRRFQGALNALDAALKHHKPQQTANGITVCPRCSNAGGQTVKAPCPEVRDIASALTGGG